MKNYLLGIIFLGLAFYLLWQQGNQQIEYANQNTGNPDEVAHDEPSKETPMVSSADQTNDDVQSIVSNPVTGLQSIQLDEEVLNKGLETDLSSFVFSNHFGAIRSISLHKSDRLNKSYELQNPSEPFLAIAFEDSSGRVLDNAIANPRGFKIVENSANKLVYRWQVESEFRIDRIYERSSEDGYVIQHRTVFENLKDVPTAIDRVRLSLGSHFQIPRMYNPFDQASTYLSVGYYNDGAPLAEGCSCATCSGRIDGEKEEFFQLNEMGPTGKIEPRRLSKAKWVCVNNQFFVNLVRPESELSDLRIWGESIQSKPDENGYEPLGIRGTMSFPLGILNQMNPKNFLSQYIQDPKIM